MADFPGCVGIADGFSVGSERFAAECRLPAAPTESVLGHLAKIGAVFDGDARNPWTRNVGTDLQSVDAQLIDHQAPMPRAKGRVMAGVLFDRIAIIAAGKTRALQPPLGK